MANLKQLLKKAAGQYDQRKAAAEGAVVRWEAFSGTAHDPRPYYFERYQQNRGRRIAKANPKCSQYGFDAHGRCLVAREPKTKDSPAYEEFFSYRGPNVESAAYRVSSGNPLFYVAQQKHSGGNIVACDMLNVGPAAEEVCERYRYAGGRLQGIDIHESGDGISNKHRFDVLYDKAGRMIAIRKFYDYLPKRCSYLPIYWNPETAPSFDEMWTSIRDRLIELIPRAIGKPKLPTPAYCVAIVCHSGEKDELPPILAIGLESELAANSVDKKQKQKVWNAKTFKKFPPGSISIPGDEDLKRLCDWFQRLSYSRSDIDSPSKVLSEISLALNRRDWSKQMPVTKDFVVFVTDLDDELREMYWRRDLNASIPAAKLQKLKQQKLL